MNVRELIKSDEGLKLKPYYDTAVPPLLTIGYGRCLDLVGISQGEADVMLANDIDAVTKALNAAYPWFFHLSEVRQAAMVSLRFNLGNRLSGFVKFLAAMERKDWQTAAKELENSAWFGQVKTRGPRLVKMIREDAWP